MHGLCTGTQSNTELEIQSLRVQELCESRGGRPGLHVPNSLYGLCGRKATLNLNYQNEWAGWSSGKGVRLVSRRTLGRFRFGCPFGLLKYCDLWALSCDFAPHNNETLKWFSSLPIFMQNHSGGDIVLLHPTSWDLGPRQ